MLVDRLVDMVDIYQPIFFYGKPAQKILRPAQKNFPPIQNRLLVLADIYHIYQPIYQHSMVCFSVYYAQTW